MVNFKTYEFTNLSIKSESLIKILIFKAKNKVFSLGMIVHYCFDQKWSFGSSLVIQLFWGVVFLYEGRRMIGESWKIVRWWIKATWWRQEVDLACSPSFWVWFLAFLFIVSGGSSSTRVWDSVEGLEEKMWSEALSFWWSAVEGRRDVSGLSDVPVWVILLDFDFE